MTLYQICDNIRRVARRSEAITDDDALSLAQIAEWVRYYRSKSIQFASDMGKEWSMLTQVKQTLTCNDLLRIDVAECSKYDWGQKVLKYCPMPKFMDFPEHRGITYVGTVDGRNNFNYAEPATIADKKKTRFGYLFNFFWTAYDPNDKFALYVVPADVLSDMRAVKVEGVFNDPREVDECINEAVDFPCSPDYPLISGTEADIMQQIMSRELGFTLRTTADQTNNAKSDV